jgi:nucleoside-diphosphate-sugar epimerase
MTLNVPFFGTIMYMAQVIQRFLNKENPFQVYGYDQTRAFNYIDDAVNGTITAMESFNTNGEILHIGDMESEISIEELVYFIGELLGFKGTYQRQAAHSGSVSRRCPDTSKAEKLIGYKPQTQWKNGVEKTVNWYKDYLLEGGDVFE